jgi:hypothetical protein
MVSKTVVFFSGEIKADENCFFCVPPSRRYERKGTCWSSCLKGFYGQWSINGQVRHSACYQGSQSGKLFIKGHRVREYDNSSKNIESVSMTRCYVHKVQRGQCFSGRQRRIVNQHRTGVVSRMTLRNILNRQSKHLWTKESDVQWGFSVN